MFFLFVLLACVVFFICSRFVNPFLSATVALSSFWMSGLVLWFSGPGTVTQILMIGCLGGMLEWIKTRKMLFLMLAGFLAGFCFNFKQTGVFSVVALVQIISLQFCVFSNVKRWHRIFFTLPGLILLLAFIPLRLNSHLSFPTQNYWLLIPWVLSTMLILLFALFPGKERFASNNVRGVGDFVRHLAILVFSIIIGLAPLCLWYLFKGVNLLQIIHETFIRMPKTIDHWIAPIPDITLQDITLWFGIFGTFGVSIFLKKAQYRSNGLYILTWGLLLFLSIVLTGCVLYGPKAVLEWRVANYLLWFSDATNYHWQWFAIIWLPIGLLTSWFFLRTKSKEPAVMTMAATLIFTSTISALMFPYPSTLYTSGIFITSCIIFGSTFITLLTNDKEPRPYHQKIAGLLSGGLFIVVVAFVGIHERWIINPQFSIKVDLERWRGYTHEWNRPFVEVVNELKKLPKQDTIAGYPDLALPFFLADKPFPTMQSNFHEAPLDKNLDAFAKEIDEKRIEWVVINRSLYPYGLENSFFPKPEKLVRNLKPHYTLHHQFSYFDFYKRNDSTH